MTPHPIVPTLLGGRLTREAMKRGLPAAGKPHHGKYGEPTPSRQRGGGGWINLQPPLYPLRFWPTHQECSRSQITSFAGSLSKKRKTLKLARVRAKILLRLIRCAFRKSVMALPWWL